MTVNRVNLPFIVAARLEPAAGAGIMRLYLPDEIMSISKLGLMILAISLGGCVLWGQDQNRPGLGDHSWLVSQVSGQPVLSDSKLMLSFSDEGWVNGKAGCNGFSGAFKDTDGVLEIGQIAQTKRMCMNRELMAQEQAFLTALRAVTAYSITDGVLELAGANGSILARVDSSTQ